MSALTGVIPPRDCTVCGDRYDPTSGKQKTCRKPECKRTRARDREAARKRGDYAEPRAGTPHADGSRTLSSPFAGAVADVVMLLHQEPRDHHGVRDFMFHVKLLNDALRNKDRNAYRHTLLRIAGWTLRELARVRPEDDATGS